VIEDTIVDLIGKQSTDIVLGGILPLIILLGILVARRMVPNMLQRIFQYSDRAFEFAHVRHDWLTMQGILAFAPPLRFFISVLGIWIAILLVGVPSRYEDDISSLLVTSTMISIFWAAVRATDLVASLMRTQFVKQERTAALNETALHFGVRIAKATILIFGFVVIMQHWGYDFNGLLAGLGLTGLAVALAAQDALSNLIGYFAIMADSPFQVGDYIISDKFEGFVETIGFRTTKVRRPDRALILVPNQTMASDVLTNWSESNNGPRRGRARLNMTVGVTYNTSPDEMIAVVDAIREMLKTHDQVVLNSEVVNFVEFNDSSLDILVVCVVKVTGWEHLQATKQDINISIMRILRSVGLEIAFPTRTIVTDNGRKPTAFSDSERLVAAETQLDDVEM
jgi:MscS family membrane protein